MQNNFVKKGNVYLNTAKPQTREAIEFTKKHIFSCYEMPPNIRDFINKLTPDIQLKKGEELFTVVEIQIKGFVVKNKNNDLQYVSYIQAGLFEVLKWSN